MISFKTETFVTKLDKKKEVADSFKYPLVYYLAHVDDPIALLITIVIIDFKNGEMKQIVSFLEENIIVEKEFIEKGVLKENKQYMNPHCSFEVSKNGDILVFVENGYYFYRVDYLNNKMFVYTMEDLSSMVNEKVTSISCTVYKDKDDENYFYSAVTSKNENLQNDLLFFRHRCDLSSHKLLYRINEGNCKIPHVTRKFSNYLLNSEFSSPEVLHDDLTMNSKNFMIFVLRDLYKEYCLLSGIYFNEEIFLTKNRIVPNDVVLEAGFYKFCALKGGNFLDICKINKKYSFVAKPGKISVLNLETGEINRYETTTVTPAHFEIDEDDGVVYVSSHNFIIFDTQSFIGPACIDKFILIDGKLKKTGTFTHPTGYRFTSHKIFKYNNKKYLCTFGQPNRLFFINAETMELLYYNDIEIDLLSSQKDISDFINHRPSLGDDVVISIEVSEDGRYIFFIGSKYLYIYDFSERKIVQKIEYLYDLEFKKGINLKDFRRRTVHVNYFR